MWETLMVRQNKSLRLWVDGAVARPRFDGMVYEDRVTLISPDSRCRITRKGAEMWTMHRCGAHELVIIKWDDVNFNDYTPLHEDGTS